ncbi:type II secretion system protein GspM [Pseudomonas sp. MH2]|uniref:Type II secretion system protein GspM n=1 Tax=Pseudomonas machongensis TaxID=3110229 RepID=A0ABU5VDB9_9PSED|nr:type II secretion system protein GspM [Pseudomonas sp. MH2]MEA5671351.1 type II secretion system protein GspM [Pseudomonas sp. MH2]
MMVGLLDWIGREWRGIPAPRRWVLKAVAWGLAAITVWQVLCLPAQQRLDQVQVQLNRERALAQQLRRLSATSAALPTPAQALTTARLNERARIDGLQIVDMHSNGSQVTMTLQGRPHILTLWLHALEQDGAQLTGIRLQAIDDQLQAQLGVVIVDG